MRMWMESLVLYLFLAAEAALLLQASTERPTGSPAGVLPPSCTSG